MPHTFINRSLMLNAFLLLAAFVLVGFSDADNVSIALSYSGPYDVVF